jgi:HTH-type transcriptional regulator/antitoxin HigA
MLKRCNMNVHPIRTEADYDTALNEVEELWGSKAGTPDGERLDVLLVLIDDYESKHHAIDPPDPVEAIRFRMEQMNLTRKDLEPLIGPRGRVAEVLNRRRPLSLAMIRSLHQKLHIPLAKFSEIENAFDFVSSGAPSEHLAYVSVVTGETYWRTEIGDNFEPLPDDIDEPGKYLAIPHKNDLDLGKPLALKFAARVLPDDFDEVAGMFQRRGAYGRFQSLLERRGNLDAWYEFESESQRKELRSWCAANDIELED